LGKEDAKSNRDMVSMPVVTDLTLDECLEMSCLKEDLKIMPLKLKTPISDTSQTISGGQKTRMSLARVLY
jgi:ABC-type bacteriocin/lantibiotic exporter with double-glycine peptidase domain